jgi:hypothetical protein
MKIYVQKKQNLESCLASDVLGQDTVVLLQVTNTMAEDTQGRLDASALKMEARSSFGGKPVLPENVSKLKKPQHTP